MADRQGVGKRIIFLYNENAVILGMVYNYLSFMIMPIYTVIEKTDRSLLEAAADLGASPVKSFLRVTLPYSLPGVLEGVTMVFVPAVTTFGHQPADGRRQGSADRRHHPESVWASRATGTLAPRSRCL